MQKNNIYFVGAGGIGMAALERYFLAQGCRVAGYDRTPSDLTHALESEGVAICYDDSPELIPDAFRSPDTTLVVYTPAVPATNGQLRWFTDHGFEVVKRARVLGRVTREKQAVCFAGTHGKTTTSSMAAHLMVTAGVGCNAFLGGVLRNYGTNYLLDNASPYAVIEADEYDRSFHQLTPTVAVITSTDPDHLDIYGTEEAYHESFAHFTELIRPGGALLVHTGLKLRPRVAEGVRVHTYGGPGADFRAENVAAADGSLSFDLVTPWRVITHIELGVPVEVNVDNAVAAIAGLMLAGVPGLTDEVLRQAMASFRGAKRRFEFYLREPGRAVIDDYAHHPDELRASISSVKKLYPGRRLTVAFQPHLFSRTRDFAPAFASALSLADEVLLLPIYPAREEPIPGVTSQIILDRVTSPVRRIVEKPELASALAELHPQILLTVGAGDINLLLPQILTALK